MGQPHEPQNMNRKMRRAERRDNGKPARLPAPQLPAGTKPASISDLVARQFIEAVRCHQSGQLADAIARYDRILSLNPGIAEIHNNRGVALAGLEKPADAEAAYRAAIALKPDYAEAFNNLGNTLCEIGRLDEAEHALRTAIRLNPRWARCRTNLGLVFKWQARFGDAEAAHRQAIALDPQLAEAYHNLGEMLCRLDRLEEAEQNLRRAISLHPRYPEAFLNLAVALKAQSRLPEAEAMCTQAIALKPQFAHAHNVLGNVLLDLGRLDAAETSFRHALSLRPHFAEAYSNLGNALRELARPAEAEAAYRQAIALKPDIAETHYNLGQLLEGQDRLAEAEASYRRAVALKPDFADAHNNLGATLKFLGRFADAQRSVERALQLLPRNPSFFLNLSELKRFDAGDPDLAQLEALAHDIEALPVKQRIDLHFALAKANEDTGQRDNTIRHLLAGNALKRRHINYDEAAALEALKRVREIFTPELMQTFAGAGDPSAVPVFIVGMPRSGTTLIEQIIASHPQAFGGGELPSLNVVAAGIGPLAGGAAPFPEVFPEVMAQLSRQDLQRVGAGYVAAIARLAPHAARITDKMPSNFRFAGLIHLMQPNARIIHAVRDPLDTCFSCFSKLFAGGQYQTYDLAELGRYYRAYQLTMEHWRRVLPPGRILDVRYEDVVADLAGQARRIIAYCGLDWNERCLAFHQTERPVHTASASQVREPIYQSAIGRAQQFAPFLAPLLDALSASDTM
jgi:tetratricopeptide (TPR) repeat protein